MRINMIGAPGWTIRTVRLNGTDITDGGIDFNANEDITGLEVELTNKLTAIRGLVTNGRGETLKDYTAIAFAQDQDKWKVFGRYQRSVALIRTAGSRLAACRRATTTSSRSTRSIRDRAAIPISSRRPHQGHADHDREGETRTVDLKHERSDCSTFTTERNTQDASIRLRRKTTR